jgi:hypothetical protein
MPPFPRPNEETLRQWQISRTLADDVLLTNDDQAVLCFSYEISDEPMSDRWLDDLSPEDRARIDDASQRLHEHDPGTMIAEFEALKQEFADVPKIYNHLAVAYVSAGRKQDYRRIVHETYERFPDYLFGIIGMGELALMENRLEDIPDIFHHTMVLHQLQGGRRSYHLSEVTAFYAFFGRYFCKTGDVEVAASYLDMLEQLNSDHPLVEQLRKLVMFSMMGGLPGFLASMLGLRRGPRKKSAKKKTPTKRRKN